MTEFISTHRNIIMGVPSSNKKIYYKQMKSIDKFEANTMLPSWNFINNGIEKEFIFSDFNQAFGFMARVGLYCEQMNHHPEWSNIYNVVKIRLNTHSHNAVTELDLKLAQLIDTLI